MTNDPLVFWTAAFAPSVSASSLHANQSLTVHHIQVPLATCSGTGCNDRDPYATGCAGGGASWKVVASASIYINGRNSGYTQLWWSNTCQTNWTRTVCTASCTQITAILNVTGLKECSDSNLCASATNTQDLRTKQRYLPSTTAQACGGLAIDPFQGSNCTGFYAISRV